jgi:translation initiation factor eIF-2B subunit delta
MKPTPEYFKKQVESIQNDFRSGSATIARNAVYILKNTVMSHGTEINKNELIDFAKQLKNAKPSMAALQNILQTCIYEIGLLDNIQDFPVKAFKILKEMDTSTEKCINNTIQILKENNYTKIITCTFSSTILKLFESVAVSGNELKVYIIESVFNKIDYGKQLYDKCLHNKIDADYILIKDAEKIINNIDCAIIGADRILTEGSVVNGTPSLFLAQKMQNRNKPFYAIAENFKHSDIIIVEPGFEFIDKKFITKIISNKQI